MQDIKIAGRTIGRSQPPYIVAEMSGNHNASLERALAIVTAAKAAGCDALKIQTYTPDTMTLDIKKPGFVVEGGLWDGQTLYDLYKGAQLPWEWHAPIFEKGRELGITVFSSPFDETAVDLLEKLDAPVYKIASFELVDLPLIRRCARTKKPMIMSTGMASLEDIEEALACARGAGADEIVLLHCVSGYPTPASDLNLRTINDLAERFAVPVGLSDHTMGIGAAVSAVALGSVLVEKHFTLARKDGGTDSAFSMEPDEMARLCSEVRTAWQALGGVRYGPNDSDRGNTTYRRSLYAVRDIATGETITPDNVRSIRPALGLAPKHYDEVMGARATRAISRGTPMAWDLIERGAK